MTKHVLPSLCLSAVLCAAMASAAAEDAVYSCTAADGSVELVSAPNGEGCEKLVAAPAADASVAPAAPTPAASVNATAAAAVAVAETADVSTPPAPRTTLVPPPAVAQQPRNSTETLLAQHRDTVIGQVNDVYTGAQTTAAANPAVSRRYLMVNRSAYQQSLGITPQ